MTTRELLLTAWDPRVAAPLSLLALGSYGLWFRARLQRRAAFFVAAVALFFLAIASPVGVLARGVLFSAHMLQHLVFMLAIPPLLLLGLPLDVAPLHARTASHKTTLGYVAPWAAGVAGMWIWHARVLCNAAAVSPGVRAVQIASLLLMGLAFWRPIVSPRRSDRMATFPAIAYLFAACVACTILGITVTLSPVEVCSAYLHPSDPFGAMPLLRDGWGLSHEADQEIGGLMMWVPACLVYAAAILTTLGRYYAEEHVSPLASRPSEGAQ